MSRGPVDTHSLLLQAERNKFELKQSYGQKIDSTHFRGQTKNKRLEKKRVDQSAINKILNAKVEKEKKAKEEAERKKQNLLKKRQEADGGAYARKILANQKATVKVKVERDPEPRSKSKESKSKSKNEAVATSSFSKTSRRVEHGKEKEQNVKKRKSDNSSGSDLYQKKSKKEKPKPKPQPQDFHSLIQRAQQQKNGKNFETPNSSSNGKADRLTKFETKTEDDTEYLEWGLDQQETRFYKAIKKKQEEAQNRGKELKLDSFEEKMKVRIKAKRKAWKTKQKAEKLKAVERAKSSKFQKSVPPKAPAPSQKPKSVNAYMKKEIKSGKKIEPKYQPPPPKPNKPDKNEKKIKKEKSRPDAKCSISIQSSAPQVKYGREIQQRPPPTMSHGRAWPPHPLLARPRRSFDEEMYDSEEEDEYDDDLDGFIASDDEDDPLNGRVSEIMRKTCSIFKLKSGGVYNAKKFAYEERGLSDKALARSMGSSARDVQAEEARALRLARQEDKLEKERGAVSVGGNFDDSD